MSWKLACKVLPLMYCTKVVNCCSGTECDCTTKNKLCVGFRYYSRTGFHVSRKPHVGFRKPHVGFSKTPRGVLKPYGFSRESTFKTPRGVFENPTWGFENPTWGFWKPHVGFWRSTHVKTRRASKPHVGFLKTPRGISKTPRGVLV